MRYPVMFPFLPKDRSRVPTLTSTTSFYPKIRLPESRAKDSTSCSDTKQRTGIQLTNSTRSNSDARQCSRFHWTMLVNARTSDPQSRRMNQYLASLSLMSRETPSQEFWCLSWCRLRRFFVIFEGHSIVADERFLSSSEMVSESSSDPSSSDCLSETSTCWPPMIPASYVIDQH